MTLWKFSITYWSNFGTDFKTFLKSNTNQFICITFIFFAIKFSKMNDTQVQNIIGSLLNIDQILVFGAVNGIMLLKLCLSTHLCAF